MKKVISLLFLLSALLGKSQTELLDSVSLALAPEYLSIQAALENPTAVVRLNLRKQKLKKFPEEIYQLPNLQYLDISKNYITELPDSIVKLKNLQYLIASRNGMLSLPKNIGDLQNLVHLNVNQNEIEVIPYSFGKLEKLEVADLWSNNLSYFPETMANLKSLKWMDLRNILISVTNQERLRSWLPDTDIKFSPACNCAN